MKSFYGIVSEHGYVIYNKETDEVVFYSPKMLDTEDTKARAENMGSLVAKNKQGHWMGARVIG